MNSLHSKVKLIHLHVVIKKLTNRKIILNLNGNILNLRKIKSVQTVKKIKKNVINIFQNQIFMKYILKK